MPSCGDADERDDNEGEVAARTPLRQGPRPRAGVRSAADRDTGFEASG